jgi:hypothetical protein
MRASLLVGLCVALTAVAACGGDGGTDVGTPLTMEAGSSQEPLGEDGGSGSSSGSSSTSRGSDDGAASGAGDSAIGTSGASSGGTSSGGADGGACTDPCPASKGGVTFGCEKRFLTGVNYAWKTWVADFGGVAAWGETGVAANQAAITTDLQDMKNHGVDVIRWWMLQQLAGDAVQFDSGGTPTGTGGTLVADIQAALDLAAQIGVHYNFTIFSFDDFAPNGTSSGATLHGLKPIVTDTAKRAALMNVIKTVARTVESSLHRDRVVSWDVINEPEWVISDSDPYGDPAFSPNAKYEAISFAQMETFLTDTVTTLHQNSSAPVTVGGAAIKWAHAFSHVGLDYYTFHMYDWVNQYYPYDQSLASYGVTDKPSVMGEFPLDGLAAVNGKAAVPLSTMLGTLLSIGYAGAMPWAVDDTCCGSWSSDGAQVESFAAAHACSTKF